MEQGGLMMARPATVDECKFFLEAAYGEIEESLPAKVIDAIIFYLDEYEKFSIGKVVKTGQDLEARK